MGKIKNQLIKITAQITRRFHPRGTERFLKLIYSPDKRTGNSIETVMDYEGGKIRINTRSFIEWITYFKGHYEPEVTDFINSVINSDSVSIDVGANIGIHTIELAKGKMVYAFEPNPTVYKRLGDNILLSKLNNVKTFQVGLSDKEGHIDFYLAPGNNSNQGQSTIHGDFLSNKGEKIRIKIDTIDALFKDLERLDFIKIDVEGHDFNVILGAVKTIKRFQPTIIFEYGDGWNYSGHNLQEAKDFFSKMGYSLSTIDSKPLSEANKLDEIIAIKKR